jgi:aralkylamine N-acetyltransferase
MSSRPLSISLGRVSSFQNAPGRPGYSGRPHEILQKEAKALSYLGISRLKMLKADLRISENMEEVNWIMLCDVFRRAPLGTREPDLIKRTFHGSQLKCFAYLEDQLIGAGRALTDGVRSAAIFDVVVMPDLQGQGIGTAILQWLLDRLPPSVILVSVPGREEFYKKLGFRRLLTGFARYRDPEAAARNGFIE